MPPELPELVPEAASPAIAADLGRAAAFVVAQHAGATRRAYRSDWTIFRAWCEGRGVAALPAAPEAVAAFLAVEAERGVKAATLARRAAAIRYVHAAERLEPP